MRYFGGKGDAPRPIKDREQFEKNWDQIFKRKEACSFCDKLHPDNFECEEKTRWFAESEARYQSDRAKRMGGDDGWRGD